jgi:hypothetical protein
MPINSSALVQNSVLMICVNFLSLMALKMAAGMLKIIPTFIPR